MGRQDTEAVYHVELRQFPHVARAFNLTREELDARILRPLASGRTVELNERKWTPGRLKLVVYEGPELAVADMGLGRGWGNATKHGENVTQRLLTEARREVEAPPALDLLKQAIAERAEGGPLGFEELLPLVSHIAVDADANERVELAARAVWELLREGRVRLAGGTGGRP